MEAFEPLGLTPAQREQVQVILERRRTQMDAFWQEARPRLRAVVDSTETEIRALLSPEQQAAFDRMRAERREMMQKKHPEWKGVPDSAATHLDDTAPEER
jgi:Spy/CpxP family protein refolding chaperone